jgi:hypothetical protein
MARLAERMTIRAHIRDSAGSIHTETTLFNGGRLRAVIAEWQRLLDETE